MARFKVGDRVRRVKPCMWPFEYGEVGSEYTVLKVCKYGGIVVIPGMGSATAGDLELIPPTAEAVSGAIRTVARREIVPGRYGDVTVRTDGYIDTAKLRSAEQLREAAHLFNQLAEVLEENAALETKEAA